MVSAGEVEQFAYCAHNWFLARRGIQGAGAGAGRGIALHQEVDDAHQVVHRERAEEQLALRWMALVLGMAGSALVLTFEVLLIGDTPHRFIMVSLGLFLVGASAALLVIAMLARRRAERAVAAYGLHPEKLAASGATGSGPLMEDPEWDLRGTPDLLLETRDGLVPVEIKTGRTPRRPHRSHVLQLACYLRLLEASRGTRPRYGLVQYPEGVFRVDWTPALEQELRAKVERLHAAQRAGQADRDHDHVARCRGCARRDACDQALA